jgi:hypothetical protein
MLFHHFKSLCDPLFFTCHYWSHFPPRCPHSHPHIPIPTSPHPHPHIPIPTNSTTVTAAGALYGVYQLYSLYGQYQDDLEKRREDYQEQYEKFLEQKQKRQEIADKKAAERQANADKKQKRVEEKKKQQQERATSLQKEREQQRLDKEKEKQNISDAKKKAALDKEKSPALIDVTTFFQLPQADIIAILQESQSTLIRDVQTFGPLAITGGRNATQPARRTALRNQSIYNQISNINVETLSKLEPRTRLEIGLWLAYFTRVKYADVTSRGFKRGELIRDNELVLRYLTFQPEDLTDFQRANMADLHRTIMDVAQVIDDIDNLAKAYDWIYNNSPLAKFIADGGDKSTEKGDTDAINQPNAKNSTDVAKRDEELEAKTLYLSVPVEQRVNFKTNLDLYSIVALLPVSCVLGRWEDFRKLASDYLVYSPPGPNSGLVELQRSFSQLPHEPNVYALHQMATEFTPTIEELGPNGISIPFIEIPAITAEMTQEQKDEIQKQMDDDTNARFEAFVTQMKQSLSTTPEVPTPMAATTQNYPLNTLSFKEYHIRSALIEFNPGKSYHMLRTNLSNYKSATREPKLYGPGDKKVIIRGGVACIQDINTQSAVFHFGPYDGSQRYVFVSETLRAVARTTVNQTQVFMLEQGPEDVYGKSTWTGYFRITQTPTGQTEYKPTFSFFFDTKLECQRVLTQEEKAKCDELLANEALEEAKRQAEAEEKNEAVTEEVTQTESVTPVVAVVEPEPVKVEKVEEAVKVEEKIEKVEEVTPEEKSIAAHVSPVVIEAVVEPEPPKVEEKKEEAPVEKVEAKVEEAKVETKAEEAKVETKAETKAEEAKVETKAEEAKVETKVEEAKVEAKVETKAEENKAEEAKVEENKVEKAKVEEAKVEETKAEETKVETKTETKAEEETKTEKIAEELVVENKIEEEIENIHETTPIEAAVIEPEPKDEEQTEGQKDEPVVDAPVVEAPVLEEPIIQETASIDEAVVEPEPIQVGDKKVEDDKAEDKKVGDDKAEVEDDKFEEPFEEVIQETAPIQETVIEDEKVQGDKVEGRIKDDKIKDDKVEEQLSDSIVMVNESQVDAVVEKDEEQVGEDEKDHKREEAPGEDSKNDEQVVDEVQDNNSNEAINEEQPVEEDKE